MASCCNLLVGALLLGVTSGLQLPASLSRRQVAQLAGAGMLGTPLVAFANTAPMLSEPMAGFDDAASKRAAFMEKQKKFKKAWRKELSNLEFSTSDKEFETSCESLFKLIVANNYEIPEGVRKQDLDQVYKRVKDSLGKGARMEFQKLDKLVLDITSVKSLKGMDELGY